MIFQWSQCITELPYAHAKLAKITIKVQQLTDVREKMLQLGSIRKFLRRYESKDGRSEGSKQEVSCLKILVPVHQNVNNMTSSSMRIIRYVISFLFGRLYTHVYRLRKKSRTIRCFCKNAMGFETRDRLFFENSESNSSFFWIWQESKHIQEPQRRCENTNLVSWNLTTSRLCRYD